MIQDPKHPTYYKVYIDSITLGAEPIDLESNLVGSAPSVIESIDLERNLVDTKVMNGGTAQGKS